MNSAKKSAHPANMGDFALGILKGCLAGMGAALVLMLIATAVALATPDPGKITSALGYVVLALSSFAGGVFAVRFTGDGILSGLICGCAFSFILWAISLIPALGESTLSPGVSALMHLIPCAAGTLGSVFGKKRPQKRRKRRR